jgi:site-specific DNA recombinase
MRSKSPKYVCRDCKNKISPEDLEEIYHSQLKSLLFSETELEKHLQTEQQQIGDKKKLIDVLITDIQKLHTKIKDTFELYHEGKIQKDAFESYHKPLYEELKQKEVTLNETQSYIDSINVQSLSNEQVLHDARDLYTHWSNFSNEEKKTIIEAITENIVISERDITINLSYIPTLTHDAGVAMNPGSSIILPILVQLSNERAGVHRSHQHKRSGILHTLSCAGNRYYSIL